MVGEPVPRTWKVAIYPAVNPVHVGAMAIEDMPISYETYRLHTIMHPVYKVRVDCYVLEGLDLREHVDEIYFRLTGFNAIKPKKEKVLPEGRRIPIIKRDKPEPVEFQEVELKEVTGQVHVLVNGRVVMNIYGKAIYFQKYEVERQGFKAHSM